VRKIGCLWLVASLLMTTEMSHAAKPQWPPLPVKGFVSGRAASEQDVKDGKPIFVAKVGTV
jgi:hypothetical protein